MRLSQLGRKHSLKAKEKMRQSHLGKRNTLEYKIKMSVIAKEKGFGKWMVGKKHSEETKKKLIGNKNALGSKGRTGQKKSREERKKLSETKKGHLVSFETRQKLFIAMKGRIPPNKGQKGIQKGWNKGIINRKKYPQMGHFKKHTKLAKIKMSKIAKERMSKGIAIPPIARGEKNHFWKGGIAFEPYTPDFNKNFKDIIRARDNYICQLCNKNQSEFKRKLSIHHINYDKLLSIPQNCISLCIKCHGLTNLNRTEWISFFHSILSKKYNYEYTQSQEIVVKIRS